jgi:hypothetical protein
MIMELIDYEQYIKDNKISISEKWLFYNLDEEGLQIKIGTFFYISL